MKKSRDAFRTISEVAEWLDIPTHVLRFWESRFTQIKPVKRAGGRRYYRPSDMLLIGGVKVLLHDDGMTIRGVQKLLREKGVKYVSAFSPELQDSGEDEDDVIEHEAAEGATGPAPVFASRAARQTHAASPAPASSADADDDQPDMFPETRAPAAHDDLLIEDEGEDAPEQPDIAAAAPDDPQPAPLPRAIPATPDVPEVDVLDDDASIPADPGIAARLALARPAVLAAHHEALLAARDRLRALRAARAEQDAPGA